MDGLEEESANEECTWYWLNIMIDTTFGVGVVYCFLQLATSFLQKYYDADFKNGTYGPKGTDWKEDPSYRMWFGQLLLWLCIVCSMKLIVVIIMYVLHPVLLVVGKFFI